MNERANHVSARLQRWADALGWSGWSAQQRVTLNAWVLWCEAAGRDPRDPDAAELFLAAQAERLAPGSIRNQRIDLARLFERGGLAAAAARLRGVEVGDAADVAPGLKGARDRLVHVLLGAGLNAEEIARLDVADVEIGADLVVIRAGRRELAAPVTSPLADAIERWRAESGVEGGALIRDVRGGSVRPERLSARGIRRIADRFCGHPGV